MTDRELLTLAAKAAGLNHPDGWDWITNELGDKWNPLTDDGDRYRLARTLKMRICFDTGGVFIDRTHVGGKPQIWEPFTPGNETEEAYAIVRAAAEIGRDMKEE